MKLQQINEANLTKPPVKRSLNTLLQYFEKEHDTYLVRKNYQVWNRTRAGKIEPGILKIEFTYENEPEMNDHVLVTYHDDDQDDMLISDMIRNFVVDEIRRLY